MKLENKAVIKVLTAANCSRSYRVLVDKRGLRDNLNTNCVRMELGDSERRVVEWQVGKFVSES